MSDKADFDTIPFSDTQRRLVHVIMSDVMQCENLPDMLNAIKSKTRVLESSLSSEKLSVIINEEMPILITINFKATDTTIASNWSASFNESDHSTQ